MISHIWTVTYTKIDAKPTVTFKISNFENLKEKLYYKFWTKSLGDVENLHNDVTELNEYSLSKFSQNIEHNYI